MTTEEPNLGLLTVCVFWTSLNFVEIYLKSNNKYIHRPQKYCGSIIV